MKAKHHNDTGLLEVLPVVREELDEVEESFIDDLTYLTAAERDRMAGKDVVEDEGKEKEKEEDKEEDKETDEDERNKEQDGEKADVKAV
ncbi:hypothetical protein AA0112_g9222 [Alternaria arborescens]|nr:hypothetical protein AA0112_g9222 [Alternaria arborescens]